MDVVTFVPYSTLVFWVLVVLETLWAAFVFYGFWLEYENDLSRFGVYQTRRDLLFAGMMCMGMPAAQIWFWTHSYMVIAWGLVMVVLIFWGWMFSVLVYDTKRRNRGH